MGQNSSMSLEQALSGCLGDALSHGGDARLRMLVLGRPVTLQPTTREQIFLIVREAVVNALRHSGSTDIKVEIEYLPHRLRLRVQDNGCGIDSKVIQSGRATHSGLTSLQERADTVGAQLRIWSKERGGMLVEASVPIDRVPHASPWSA